jgi:hypothetical protein
MRLHITPVGWLNLVERWFAALAEKHERRQLGERERTFVLTPEFLGGVITVHVQRIAVGIENIVVGWLSVPENASPRKSHDNHS